MRALTMCLALSACVPWPYSPEMVQFKGAQITLTCPLPIDSCSVGGGLVGY